MGELRARLQGKGALEILIELFEGDPLGLADRGSAWMARECYLLDARKLAIKAMIAIANDLPGPTETDLDGWLDGVFEVCSLHQLRDDALDAERNDPLPEPMEPRYAYLARKLSLEPSKVRRACLAANCLPTPERRAFHHMIVQRLGFGRYARVADIDPREARALLIRAVELIHSALEREDADDD